MDQISDPLNLIAPGGGRDTNSQTMSLSIAEAHKCASHLQSH